MRDQRKGFTPARVAIFWSSDASVPMMSAYNGAAGTRLAVSLQGEPR